jgi:hypothetical protein
MCHVKNVQLTRWMRARRDQYIHLLLILALRFCVQRMNTASKPIKAGPKNAEARSKQL